MTYIAGNTHGFGARIIAFLQRTLLWVGGIAFAALAATGAFFIAIAALIGSFILGGAVALAWFLFRLFGNQPRRGASDSDTLDATRGPDGWTVNGR